MHKRFHIRSLSLLLILTLLLAFITGCNTTPPDDTTVGNTTEGITTEEETEPTYLDLFVNGETPYTLICPEDPTNSVFNSMIKLQTAITELTGVELEFTTDFYNPFSETLPETAYEILIGSTNRLEAKEARAMIREKDFIIYEKNNRIVILGGNDAATAEAVAYFIENYLIEEKQNIVIKQGEKFISRYNYDLGVISIDGVDLMNYQIVVPKNPETLFPYFAALNLMDYLSTEAGIELPLVYDDAVQTNYEIVIGETNRPESKSAMQTPLADNQYILKQVDSSLYMYGKDYMVGGAVSKFINGYILPANELNNNEIDITGIPTSNLAEVFTFPKKATSALILIGDGMGQNHVDSTFKNRKDTFLAEYLENIGVCTTYQYGNNEYASSYTDSAASATALATGYKTKNSYLGVDHKNQRLLNVRELASQMGAATAVLTSDVITGATPAGFLCHWNSRKATATLQSQINSVLKSDKNLLFATSVNDNRNQLLPETREILYTIADASTTFFAMIEEAHIDKESHNNKLASAQACVLRYNDIIGYCIQFVMLHPETALVITADHECGGLTIDGGNFSYTSGNHTNTKVPVYALGPGTEIFKGVKVDNTDIGKFLGSVYTSAPFGDQTIG